MFSSQFRCPDCGGSAAYRSRRRSVFERYVLPFLLLRPVRCANCFRRSSVSVFVVARPRETRSAIKPRAA